ncbi:MAG TPA: right-handed parallel beta-helix repeat-containing protein [Bacteroidales bacterium]|nr:right-handed parallel beta-helix repeat-containing protein [Bacteroidales bacterium]HRZ48356.1 right-handed parallel beta-helix repeat-containing protein [Bacteroidales bacterium]
MKKLNLLIFLLFSVIFVNAQDVYIYSNTTWSSDQTINGNLWIWNGAELRIDPGVTVDFVNSGTNRIIIRPDGSLRAGGVNFISSTGLWYGISMDGLGDAYPQLGSPAQPKLRLTECYILNASYPVNNWYSNPYTRTGGYIILDRCVIEGFETGVWFSNYRPTDLTGNYVNDKSRIIETEFIGGYNASTIGVYMYRVNNIQVLGCTFDNVAYPDYFFTGIHIIGSSAIIKSSPNTTPPYTPIKNQFLDCTKGVYIDNGYLPTIKVTVRDGIFQNVYYPQIERVGIQAIAARNLDLFNNQIQLAIDCQSSPCTSPKQYGIHLNGCSGFQVEGNEIEVSNNKGNFENTYGIVVVNSGSQSNELYRNTVTDCYYSIQALNKNRGIEHPTQPDDDGLRCFCNTLVPIKTDDFFALSASVEPAGLNDPVYGVARMQGGSMTGYSTSPAFNIIERPYPLATGSERDFFNNHQGQNPWNLSDIVYMEPKFTSGSPWYYIEYYTGNQNNFGIPNHVQPTQHSWITDDQDLYPHCESRIPSQYPELPAIVGNIFSTASDYVAALGDF